jgi:glycerophosphoryl diester phosphodiesterase
METTRIPLIIGHRGASALAPENTLFAFAKAIEDGAEGLEFDVRLSRDGVPVVIHDETLLRTAGVNALVSDLTADELSRLDAAKLFVRSAAPNDRAGFGRAPVPTLSALLKYLKGFSGRLYIELKCGEHDLAALTDAVCEVLRSSDMLGNSIVKSFRLGVISRAKILLPEVKTAALFAPKIMNMLRKEKYLVKIGEEFGADELSIHHTLATRRLTEAASNRGLPVTVWTVDHPRWIERARRRGVKALISNDPGKMLSFRDRLAGPGR